MDISSLVFDISTIVISLAALLISLRAQRTADASSRPNVRFHLTCHTFNYEIADIELIVSNLSSKANALVKVQVSLMDGPPAMTTLRFKDGGAVFAKAGVELPPHEQFDGEVPFALEPVDPDRPIRSIGATLKSFDFEPPLNIAASSSISRRLVFELPDRLPEHALDSLRLWVQARDIDGKLWDQMIVLSEGVVESSYI
jgi:hypothetical protein